jgi:aminoglycoside phosphotransferase (APT) family kinase protein
MTTARDLEQTRKRLTEWFLAKLPEAHELQMSGLTRPGTTGFSTDTLLFDLTWTEKGRSRREELVVRIEPTGLTVFPTYDLPLQFQVMELLAETPVPVPRVFWLEESAEVLGAPFCVMQRVAGRIPTDNPPYHTDGWMTEISPEDRAQIWWSGLDTLARIHTLDWRAAGFEFLEDQDSSETPLQQQIRYYDHFLEWAARGKPHPTTEAAFEWLKKNQPSGEPVVLCWGDARLGNMIFRENRCVAVLDWEMVNLGSPEADFAWWLFFDDHHSAGCGFPRLDGLPSREETIERYQESTGHTLRHVKYYEVFAGFRFSVMMMRVAQQLVEGGFIPPDSPFERNNICTRLLAEMLDLPPPE